MRKRRHGFCLDLYAGTDTAIGTSDVLLGVAGDDLLVECMLSWNFLGGDT
jgi:hypothetical protein